MRNSAAAVFMATSATILGLSSAMADDWTAVRLRGGVFALENGAWIQLVRGSVVPDDRVIKSAPGGRITLVRGAETIELGPDTTAQISDKGGFTTVYNHEGTVGVDAEARNVQHFSVQTPFLAAVVKGTAFVVETSPTASTVTVARGTVEVDDAAHDTSTSVSAGQQVTSAQESAITAATVIAAPRSAPVPPAPAARQPPVPTSTAQPAAGGSPAHQPGNSAQSSPGPGGHGLGGNGPGGDRPGDKGPGGNGNGDGHGHDGNNGPGGSGPGGGNGPSGNGSGDKGPGGNGSGGNGNSGGNGGHGNDSSGPGNGDNGKGPGGDGPGGSGPGGNGNGDGGSSDDNGHGRGNGNGNGKKD